MIAFLDTFGGSEMMLIMVVVLIFFGGDKMPGFARGLGKAIREFKKAANEVEQEFKHIIEESEKQGSATTPIKPPARPPEPVIELSPSPPPAPLPPPQNRLGGNETDPHV